MPDVIEDVVPVNWKVPTWFSWLAPSTMDRFTVCRSVVFPCQRARSRIVPAASMSWMVNGSL